MNANNSTPPFIELIRWEGSKDIKIELLLRITSLCNLRCKYCFSQKRFGSPGLDDILTGLKKIIKAEGVKPRDPVLINITGGEPLIRKDLFFLLESLRAVLKNYSINLQTNATLIDDTVAQRLRSLNISSAFVGIAALSEKDYSSLTQRRGYYNKALSGIECLLNVGIAVCINFVISRVLEKGLQDLPAFIYDRFGGAVSVNLSSLSPGTPEEFLRSYGIDYRRCGRIFEEVYGGLKKKGIPYSAPGGDCSPPICMFRKREIIRSYSFGSTPLNVIYVSDFSNISDGFRYKSVRCKRCRYDNYCKGVSSLYARVFGEANFCC